MAWRGRGRGRPGGMARHDMALKDGENPTHVPVTFPPVSNMPPKASGEDQHDAETQRLLVRTWAVPCPAADSPAEMLPFVGYSPHSP